MRPQRYAIWPYDTCGCTILLRYQLAGSPFADLLGWHSLFRFWLLSMDAPIHGLPPVTAIVPLAAIPIKSPDWIKSIAFAANYANRRSERGGLPC